MKLTAQEKQEVIKLVEGSELGVHQTLQGLGIAKSTFYKWYKACLDQGLITAGSNEVRADLTALIDF
jgi:transposase-like protein